MLSFFLLCSAVPAPAHPIAGNPRTGPSPSFLFPASPQRLLSGKREGWKIGPEAKERQSLIPGAALGDSEPALSDGDAAEVWVRAS